MARSRTDIGTTGAVTVSGQVKDATGHWVAAAPGTTAQRWRARTKVRDSDGVLRDVERFAVSKAQALTRLKLALRERDSRDHVGSSMRATMSVQDAAMVWVALMERADSGLAPSTRRVYRGTLRRHVLDSPIAHLTIQEANRMPVLRDYLQRVADEHGTGTAKTVRAIISSLLKEAVAQGVITHNAMREVRATAANAHTGRIRDTRRAFTRAERDHVVSVADTDQNAVALDVSDIIAWLAGTGVRIGEALTQRWSDVNLEDGTVLVRGTKTKHSVRVLSLPPWLCTRIRERAQITSTNGLLFPSPRTADNVNPRDERNVLRTVRTVLDTAGYPWATSHTFRRTVATLLDEAGHPIALAANQLGHADPAMTARVYLGRKSSTAAAAAVL